jgi:predicted AlkP superfamily phosphohydrolase/phosphomutase
VKIDRVIVIGLDGLDPSLTETMMAAGELPHLTALRAEGGYGRVGTTWPAQTPVAWSTFAVGANPGVHGIFDFLRRDPSTYLPEIGLYRHVQKSRFLPPRAINLRGGATLWERLADAGIESTILRHPCTYPPGSYKGRLLAGIGVPDLRGGFGTSTFVTTQTGDAPGEGECIVEMKADQTGGATVSLPGPIPVKGEELGLELELQVDSKAKTVVIHCPTGAFSLSLSTGEWSPWVHVRFKHGFLQTIRGLVRFFLSGTDPLRLLATPVHFDPEVPLFPISHPWDYAAELKEVLGPYATLGLAEEHNGLTNDRLDEAAYLAQCLDIMHERRAMMHHELSRLDKGLFYCLFGTPDRIQHMFWRFLEPEHPANRSYPPDPEMAGVIGDYYRKCDHVVGEAREHVDPHTLLMVVSDHGFASFQREVDLNRWLLQEGYLALKRGVEPGHQAGDLLRAVDWDRTRAYALGLAGLYVNQEGREGNGTVPPSLAGSLKEEIASRLTGLQDPADSRLAVRRVLPREALYSGTRLDDAPDLLVGFSKGYRVASNSAMGGVGSEVVTDNLRKWSGDHVVDPSLVPGVLFMNRPFNADAPHLSDLAPTILRVLGAPLGPDLEGKALLP